MIHDKKHLKYTAIPDEEMYWERVNRSLGWLGDTKQEQHNKQEKLKNVVIGIAGTGGIGGQLAQRLAQEITGLNKLPGAIEVPAQPGYVYFDTLNWTTEVKKGKWWTDDTKI